MKTTTFRIMILLILTSLITGISTSNDKKAPYFELKDLNGMTVRSSDFSGKVVILDFWATWCGPCKQEIPDFIELQKQYSKRGVVIVGVALDEYESVKKFYNDKKMNYPVLLGTNDVVKLYGGIRGIPTTFIIGKNGTIRQKFEGFRPKTVFENEIINALIK
jgi:peroxiredoxin